MNEKIDVHILVWRVKCARRFFHSYLNETKEKSTVNCYNSVSNLFHAKLKGKQLRNEAKFIHPKAQE